MHPDPLVRSLLDRAAITELMHRYCRAIDRRDGPELRSCFHPDAVHAQGGFEGASTEFCTLALARLRVLGATQHLISNVLIEVNDDTARCEAAFVAYHRVPAGCELTGLFACGGIEADLWVGGRYLDDLERRDGMWRIRRRVGAYDWTRRVPVT
jgi:SnoaL-like domain